MDKLSSDMEIFQRRVAMEEKPDDPLMIRFTQAGDWWTATVETPAGTLVGSGPTRELARDDLDWLLVRRSEKGAPPE